MWVICRSAVVRPCLDHGCAVSDYDRTGTDDTGPGHDPPCDLHDSPRDLGPHHDRCDLHHHFDSHDDDRGHRPAGNRGVR